MKSVRLVGLVLALAAAVVACGGDKSSDAAKKRWTAYNEQHNGYDAASNAVAKSVADRLVAAGYPCAGYADYQFDLIVKAYRLQGLPLALGAGQCSVGTENVLIEVFSKQAPNAADFVATKRRLICAKAKKLGRLPDGTNDFDGIPYVMAPDRTWIVEPDTFKASRDIAAKLGRPSRDMCAGIK